MQRQLPSPIPTKTPLKTWAMRQLLLSKSSDPEIRRFATSILQDPNVTEPVFLLPPEGPPYCLPEILEQMDACARTLGLLNPVRLPCSRGYRDMAIRLETVMLPDALAQLGYRIDPMVRFRTGVLAACFEHPHLSDPLDQLHGQLFKCFVSDIPDDDQDYSLEEEAASFPFPAPEAEKANGANPASPLIRQSYSSIPTEDLDMTLLHDATKGGYTDSPLRIHPSYGEWKVYVPSDEAEFRELVRKIVKRFDVKKTAMRIASVNAGLKHVNSSHRVDAYSSIDEWVEAYWQLYVRHFVCIGYDVNNRACKNLFAAPRASMPRPSRSGRR
ncbi:MAG: hypothetical protein D6816_03230 [Bacteroidetes bacterium]|nr:MAG: hypothetical protein D6816_03230 [Bacteroidota bacterium]